MNSSENVLRTLGKKMLINVVNLYHLFFYLYRATVYMHMSFSLNSFVMQVVVTKRHALVGNSTLGGVPGGRRGVETTLHAAPKDSPDHLSYFVVISS